MKACVVTYVCLLVFLAVSCGPKPEQKLAETLPTEADKHPAPSSLTARPFHQRINLSWSSNRDEHTPIKGYNIYVHDSPILGKWNGTELGIDRKPINDQPYPGDTNPATDVETFALENLTNGTEYFVLVTTVYSDSVESEPSNEVSAIPRPEGDFTLKGSFSGAQSGFSFRKLRSVPTDDLDNDLYLATINDELYLASPRRLDSVLRESKFYPLIGKSALDKVIAVTPPLNGFPGNPLLQVIPGQSFILEDQDGCCALAKLDLVNRKENTVRISFIYQPRPKTLRFNL